MISVFETYLSPEQKYRTSNKTRWLQSQGVALQISLPPKVSKSDFSCLQLSHRAVYCHQRLHHDSCNGEGGRGSQVALSDPASCLTLPSGLWMPGAISLRREPVFHVVRCVQKSSSRRGTSCFEKQHLSVLPGRVFVGLFVHLGTGEREGVFKIQIYRH